MVQTMPMGWQIDTEEGHVLQSGIVIGNLIEAEQYIRRYVSGMRGCTWEMVLLPKKEEKK